MNPQEQSTETPAPDAGQSPDVVPAETPEPPAAEAEPVPETPAEAEPVPETPADAVEHDADAQDEHGDDDEHTAAEEDDGQAHPEGGAQAEGDAKPDEAGETRTKKRRRRRRKGAAGAVAAPGAEGEAPAPSAEPAHKVPGGVFGKYVEAASGRIAAFELGVAIAGRVVRISPQVAFVDLFGKTDAYIDGAEVHDEAGQPLYRPGEMLKNARVISIAEDGRLIVSLRGAPDEAAAATRVQEALDAQQPLDGIVYGLNRGGFDVWLGGVRAFCPASQMTLRQIDDPEPLIGHSFAFVVTATKPGGKDVVVARRPLLQKEAEEHATKVRASLLPGTVIRGRVTQVRDFGVFVDLGGIEGFVHVSELSYERVEKPQDVIRPGEEVEVVVLKLAPPKTAKERQGRISLSLKALRDDPWKDVASRLHVGEKRNGKVVRTTEFGAFVELEPGIDGLLHISELGHGLQHASLAVKEGTMIDVLVERVDPDARRVSLSRWSEAAAAASADGKLLDPRSIRPNAELEVKVEKVEPTGLQVQIVGVPGRRGRGYIPNMEMGTPRGTDHRRDFPAGTSIQVKVVGFEKDGRSKLSRKALLKDEERRAFHDYRSDVAKKSTFGTFGDLLRKAHAVAVEKQAVAAPSPSDGAGEPEDEGTAEIPAAEDVPASVEEAVPQVADSVEPIASEAMTATPDAERKPEDTA